MIVRIFEDSQEVEGNPNEIVEYFMNLEKERDKYEVEQKLYIIEALKQNFEKEKKNGRKRNTKENWIFKTTHTENQKRKRQKTADKIYAQTDERN